MKRRILLGSALGALALTGSLLAAPATPAAAAGGCLGDIGSKVPVLFVHGFNEKPAVWDEMIDATSSINKIQIVKPFDYSSGNTNRKWVTDPNIGARLVAEINCEAASAKNHKIIVVAHSMGGDAILEALREDPSIASKLGTVITIGTPNQGSEFAKVSIDFAKLYCATQRWPINNYCTAGVRTLLNAFSALPALAADSQQVKNLPSWPSTVPVLAVAGNIRPTFAIPLLTNPIWGTVGVPGPYSGTDGMVTTSSALHSNKVNGLGGTFEYRCTTSIPVVLPIVTPADCEHNAMLRSTTIKNLVAAEVKEAVQKLAPMPTTTPRPSTAQANPGCPPPSDTIEQAAKQYDASHSLDRSKQIIEAVCKSGWTVVRIKMAGSSGGLESVGFVALQHVGSEWHVAASGSDSSVCDKLPANVRFGMCM